MRVKPCPFHACRGTPPSNEPGQTEDHCNGDAITASVSFTRVNAIDRTTWGDWRFDDGGIQGAQKTEQVALTGGHLEIMGGHLSDGHRGETW